MTFPAPSQNSSRASPSLVGQNHCTAEQNSDRHVREVLDITATGLQVGDILHAHPTSPLKSLGFGELLSWRLLSCRRNDHKLLTTTHNIKQYAARRGIATRSPSYLLYYQEYSNVLHSARGVLFILFCVRVCVRACVRSIRSALQPDRWCKEGSRCVCVFARNDLKRQTSQQRILMCVWKGMT